MHGKLKNRKCSPQSFSKFVFYSEKLLRKINGIRSPGNFIKFRRAGFLGKENTAERGGTVTWKIETQGINLSDF